MKPMRASSTVFLFLNLESTSFDSGGFSVLTGGDQNPVICHVNVERKQRTARARARLPQRVALAGTLPKRPLVWIAAVGAAGWGIAGLTVLPRLDVAGAFGVPLLLLFLWRSRLRATYAGVFLVVAALELYGTSIGTWRWASTLPGLGIPDGNPPSGVASGYVWFDVMALLVAPYILVLARRASSVTDDLRASAPSH